MFDRIRHDSSKGSPSNPGMEELRELMPFARFDIEGLIRVTAASRWLELPAGPMAIQGSDSSAIFLSSGELEITTPEGARHLLTTRSGGRRFPLPFDEGFQIRVRSPQCRLIQVPQRFLLSSDGQPAVDAGFEFHEGGIEDQVYLDFYQALKAGRCELPSMPDLAKRIVEVIDDPNTASVHVAKVIQTDPALAARVMSVINSAAYSTGETINSLQQAVSRMGRRQIRDLAFSFIMKGIFQTDSRPLQQRMNALWSHSVEVAAIASVLARHLRGMDPEHALLAGLIHDIGVVPVLDNAKAYPELMNNLDMLDRVVEELRGEIGALTMRLWGFGKDYINIAVHAEDWDHLGTAIPDYLDIILLAQAHAFIGKPQVHKIPAINELPAYFKLTDGRLTPRGSLVIVDQAKAEISAVQQLLGGG